MGGAIRSEIWRLWLLRSRAGGEAAAEDCCCDHYGTSRREVFFAALEAWLTVSELETG